MEKRGYCTLCRSRCGTRNIVLNDALVRVVPDSDHPTGQAMCMKGRAAPELVHSPHRIQHPMRRTRPKDGGDPGWQPISWKDALDEIAARLDLIRRESGPEAVAFCVTTPSGTPLSDSIDWIERFVRGFGSPNICYGTEICNWHKDYAHAFTFGCGMPVADYAHSGLIMLWGHNPANTWLAQAHAIGLGRTAGARLLVVDPRYTALAAQADAWLQVRPGTDAALALGLAHLLIEGEGYNAAFVRDWTNAPLLVRGDTGSLLRAADLATQPPDNLPPRQDDIDVFVAWDSHTRAPAGYDTRFEAAAQGGAHYALRGEYEIALRGGDVVRCRPVFDLLAAHCATYTPEHVADTTGVPADHLRSAAQLIADAPSVSYHAWTGVAQQGNATQTDRAIAVLYALTGSFDMPGGNRIYPRQPAAQVNGLDLITPEQRAKALGLAERPLGPPAHGWITARDMYRAILDGEPYRVRAMVGFGGNPLVSQGDVEMGHAAFETLEFHVHCDLFETPTACYADILLPVNTPWEREGLRIGFEITAQAQEQIQLRPRMVSPRGESRSDNEIVFELACRLGMKDLFFNGSLEQGWNHMLAPLGITVAQLRGAEGRIRRPLVHHDRKYARPANGIGVTGFATETRRIELYSERLLRHGYDPLPVHREPADAARGDAAYPILLTTAKSGYYCHSQHRSLVSLRKRDPLPRIGLHPTLAAGRDIMAGDWVRVRTRAGQARFVAYLDPKLKENVVAADYGWWQDCPELGEDEYPPQGPDSSNYNALIAADAADPISGSVPMRSSACNIALDPASDPDRRTWTGSRAFRVSALTPRADDVLEITFAPVDGKGLPDPKPGQHIALRVAAPPGRGAATPCDPITRAYSLIDRARDPGRHRYTIAVRRQYGITNDGVDWQGHMSGYLHTRLGVDDIVELGAPSGNFVLPLRSPQPVVLFAGGIGITPFMAYLESLAAQPAYQREHMHPVWLHYGNRTPESEAYADRIAELEKRLPRLTVRHYYSNAPHIPEAADRFATSDVVADLLILARARFYLCGPPLMMRAITEGLVARGVPAFDIFSETFRSPACVDMDSSRHCKVRFERSKTEAVWSAQRGTLLAFAESVGLTLPTGCRVGQCESCAVKIIRGQVRHLHGTEPEDPRQCLTCQAVPTMDLVIDA